MRVLVEHCRGGWALLLIAAVTTSGCATARPATPAVPPAPSSASVGTTTIVAVAPPPAAPRTPPNIFQLLGVNQLAKGIGVGVDRLRNRLGRRFPGLEAKPPLLAIADPENLKSPNPAVKSAAQIKAEEDAAPQKAKAVEYLGRIGCSKCYPDVEASLLAALDDCTEDIRFAAVSALRARAGCACQRCKRDSCCSDKIMKKLHKLAFEMDDDGCFIEPSPRVRRMARLAMDGCGNATFLTLPEPTEGPTQAPPEGPAPAAVTQFEPPRIELPQVTQPQIRPLPGDEIIPIGALY